MAKKGQNGTETVLSGATTVRTVAHSGEEARVTVPGPDLPAAPAAPARTVVLLSSIRIKRGAFAAGAELPADHFAAGELESLRAQGAVE